MWDIVLQNGRKMIDTAAQYCACIDRRKKDAKLYMIKGSLNVHNTKGSGQDEDDLHSGYPLLHILHVGENPRSWLLFSLVNYLISRHKALGRAFFPRTVNACTSLPNLVLI